ncbi:MAG: ABC transporter ATP-binding protein [Clostridiales bacterium]|nr:ABC transporter ATP-binding protein [Clostridiales bacterium]
MIKLADISVSYGDNTIYDNFSCEFGKGVNVVVGQSGSGKTTLLSVIANLVEYSGSCQSDKVAMVFQTPSLAPISVYNNVLAVIDGKTGREQIENVLKLAQIFELKDKKSTTLSGGEQQRVALARAFAANRSVLLLDEPFHSLDYGIRCKLYDTLHTLLKNYDKTVVLVTHDIDEALALADNIYLLANRPASLTHVAELTTPREQRSPYSDETIALRKQLQEHLIVEASKTAEASVNDLKNR